MKGPPLLHTKELAIGYAGQTVMSRLNLELRAGTFVCFMGPNGVGKSTLIRTLAGLQQPVKGQVIMDAAVYRPAVVLTDRITAGYMTVRQLITFGRYPYLSWNLKLAAIDLDAIEAAISRLNLEAIAERRLHELSDGQLQLAQIGRALAQETSLILLDEPTAHLDLNNRLEITLLLRKLAHESGKAVVMATHELDLALQTADEVWLAGRGDTLLTGTPEDLVLQGMFDEIFKLKGFDLRTGKVQHVPSRSPTVAVAGESAAALWTRNALARCGYVVVTDDADRTIGLHESAEGKLTWTLDQHLTFASIESLLAALHGL
ncbi:MAG TPA: ABC transporter ATP-binding protein [Chryseolinea sp.]|nr:ABC transporter ATP-binding protein [Chryseolinea sp.]